MDIFLSVWFFLFFFSSKRVYPKTSINKNGTFGGLWKRTFKAAFSLACEKEGEKEKEGELLTRSLEFEYLHQKNRCEILIGGVDISNDVISLGTCFSMFVYTGTSFHFALIGGNITAQSTGSHRGIGGGIQIPEM